MTYCNKITSNEVYQMHESKLNNTLDNCELYCPKYYQCQTVALMNDRLKENEGE